jgi:hypothetical protein
VIVGVSVIVREAGTVLVNVMVMVGVMLAVGLTVRSCTRVITLWVSGMGEATKLRISHNERWISAVLGRKTSISLSPGSSHLSNAFGESSKK